VKPDRKVSIQALTSVMRDYYKGTPFDVTEHPAFNPEGKKSPLARPFGCRDLFDLVGIKPERCIATETSGYVYISQIRDWLPDPMSGCMWFTLGPSFTSCFAPVYSGVTELVESWSRCPDFTRIDRTQVQWKFQLVGDMACLKYQEAIEDVRGVFEQAEGRFLALQPEFEDAAAQVFRKYGAEQAARFVTEYTNSCLENVDSAYGELVDYLMFRYLYRYSDVAPPRPAEVAAPTIPALPGN
jgi:dipeptidase